MNLDVRKVVQEVLEEYLRRAAEEREPAAKAELAEERRRREQLERRLAELTEESERNRRAVEQAERHSAIKSELQRLGVRKPELAFRLLKDDVFRGDDGDLYARGDYGVVSLKEHLTKFVAENPEFLPARIAGGSGASGGQRKETEGGPVDLSRIRPGMSAEEKEQVRREIARLAGKDFGDWL
jgi:chromosome segregation ATPase